MANSPTINFRLPPDLRERVMRLCEEEKRSPSDVARHALELYCRAKDQSTKGDAQDD